ncbi:MAG TPA: hypothetical protein PKN75_14160 [Bacteroidia bacterium]|nr:hypothetical protein [Bacteroidia bacterium]HNU34727.1 hypothetical protein [Bacteroidia bacterium]
MNKIFSSPKIKPVFLLFLLCCVQKLIAQNPAYDSLIVKAKEYYTAKNYFQSAITYNKAFKILGGKGYPEHRYDAARSWARANVKDSVFINLNKLADKTEFLELNVLQTDKAFMVLHEEKQWKELLKKINPNNEVYNDSLARVLNSVYDFDQRNRKKMNEIKNSSGAQSDEYKRTVRMINFADSLNLIQVINILKKHGWLSRNEVGRTGNKALWLVLQHASLGIQEKYFEVMKTAVQKGKASKTDLAYLEDRILMRQNKKQLYGTQYKLDQATGEMKLWDIEDPDNLNKRRESVGLEPM